MISLVPNKSKRVAVTSTEYKDEQYILRGLNMVLPDQVSENSKDNAGRSPYTINSRMFSREDSEQRVAIRTRKGSTRQFTMDESTVSPLVVENVDVLDQLDSGWADWYGTGTTSLDASVVYSGTKSVKIITDAISSLCGMEKDISANLSSRRMRIKVRSTDWSKVTSIRMLVSTSGTFASYYTISLKPLLPASVVANRWYTLDFSVDDFSIGGGTPSWNSVNKVILQAVGAAIAATVYFDEWVTYTPTVTANELEFSNVLQQAFPIQIPSYSLSSGFYTFNKISLQLRKTAGYIESILFELWTTSGGAPATLIGTTSFSRTDVTTTTSVVTAYLMDAPDVSSSTEYWGTLKIVGDSDAKCYVQCTGGSGGLYRSIGTTDGPWTASGKLVWYEAPCQLSGAILGAHRRVVSAETARTVVATGTGPLIAFDNSSNYELVYSYTPASYNDFSHRFRFAQEDNRTIFVNGSIQPRYWDGTTTTALASAPAAASHVFSWKNRLWMIAGNKVSFTDLLETVSGIETWPSTNFFYPSTPTDVDTITAWVLFQDNLIICTRSKKYSVMISGSGISSLTVSEISGSKGVLSQELVVADKNYVYAVAPDKQMYRFNGVSDEEVPVSDPVTPEITSMQSPELYSTLDLHKGYLRLRYAKAPSTQVDRTLILDTVNSEWFLDTGRCIGMAIAHTLEDNRLVELSSKTTAAYLGVQGYNDLMKPIDFKYWTAYKAYGSGMAKDRIKRFRPILKYTLRRFIMSIGKDVDFQNRPDMRDYELSGNNATYGDGSKYGDAGLVYGGVTLVDKAAGMSGRGKHTQYRFEKNGVDTPVEIYGYASLFKTGRNR